MPSKQAILDNVDQYSADELLVFVNDGLVTFDELCNETDGYFPAPVRKELSRKLAEQSNPQPQQSAQYDIFTTPASTPGAQTASTNFFGTPAGGPATPPPPPPSAAQTQSNFFGTPASSPSTSTPPPTPTPPPMPKPGADPSDTAWAAVDKTDNAQLDQFIAAYPESSHVREARAMKFKNGNATRIWDLEMLKSRIRRTDLQRKAEDMLVNPVDALYNDLTDLIDNRRINADMIVSVLAEDTNALNSKILYRLLANGYLVPEQLYSLGIDPRFVDNLIENRERPDFPAGEPLKGINKMSTEVYFWGIPSSGKSCVLGAVLSVADNGRVARTMFRDPDCQGYGYMNVLAELFRSGDGASRRVGILPPGTPKDATYEMAFDLIDNNGDSHPITCIDLAGEVIRMMYKSDAGLPLTPGDINTLDTVTNLLIDNRSRNRKMHFFVLEYGGEDREYEGLTQRTYLQGALNYIRRFQIFENETDAIYLLITKVDKVGLEGEALNNALREYINNSAYRSFYNGLQQICREYEINGGMVEIMPFTLGEVCFKDYCLFDDRPATEVVKRLMVRSKGFIGGRIGKFKDFFSK